MSAALALQKALRARLLASPGVTSLVPATSIIDTQDAPQIFPCIIIGEDHEVASDLTFDRRHIDVFVTLHVWSREHGISGVKEIAGEIRRAIDANLELEDARCLDIRFDSARFLRDKNRVAHGIVTLEATVEEPF